MLQLYHICLDIFLSRGEKSAYRIKLLVRRITIIALPDVFHLFVSDVHFFHPAAGNAHYQLLICLS